MNWREVTIPRAFSIMVPPDSGCYLQDNQTCFCIRINTEPPTEVLIGCFPFDSNAAPDRHAALKAEIERFCSVTVPQVVKSECGHSVEIDLDMERGLIVSQGVATSDRLRYWLVRGYCKPKGDSFYLIHWNGVANEVKGTILRMFESFVPEF